MSSYFLLVLGLIISTIAFIYVVGNLIDSSKGDKNIKRKQTSRSPNPKNGKQFKQNCFSKRFEFLQPRHGDLWCFKRLSLNIYKSPERNEYK